ncbi:hypothetical protein F2Q69_00030764 [Brassica cretica]|uniref:SHSP domain-containing protein n=1 Tax=Brassica cretica TaxID=69181 RepID=A0A8S9RST3_BRACR|nr:hypothetical protein F2Q69_00030764 [Brassica cretica]
MYLRLDLPGVGPDPGDVDISVDDSKKVLTIKALAPSLNINDSSPRSYETYVRLDCHCCEISSVDNPQVTHGVLRLLISTTPINIGGSPDDGMLFSHFVFQHLHFQAMLHGNGSGYAETEAGTRKRKRMEAKKRDFLKN